MTSLRVQRLLLPVQTHWRACVYRSSIASTPKLAETDTDNSFSNLRNPVKSYSEIPIPVKPYSEIPLPVKPYSEIPLPVKPYSAKQVPVKPCNDIPAPVKPYNEIPVVPVKKVTDQVKPFSEIPGPKGLYDIPYLGMIFHFKPFTDYGQLDMSDVFDSLHRKYGDILKLKMGAEHAIIISHPDYAEQIFRLPYKKHTRVEPPIQEMFYRRNKVVAKGLGILNGPEWENLRKPVQDNLLRPKTVANYMPLIDGVANDFIKNIVGNTEITDLYYEMMLHTSESIGMVTLNKRFGCLNGTSEIEFYSLFDRIFTIYHEAYFMPIQTFRYFRTKQYKEFENNLLIIYDIVQKTMHEQMMKLKKLNDAGKLNEHLEKEPHFLNTALCDDRMTTEQIQSVIIDMFTGAIDSTANGITLALCDLALHPDKQATLFEEVSRVVGDSSHITTEHLNRMSYLKACMKESQRKIYPVFLGGVRFMENDVTIGGYTLPKGTKVLINNEAMSKDERFFPGANEYLPERWMRDNNSELAKESKSHPFVVRPFGFGARMCPGQRIAEMQMLISIAKILQKFEVSLPPEVTEIKWSRRIFATPIDKVKLCLKHRQSRSDMP